MIDSIEQLTLRTGQEVIIMSHRDIIDTIRDTLGDPLADLVAAELTHATKSYEDELKGYEANAQEKEGIADRGERGTVIITVPALNKKKIKGACIT